MMSIVLKFSLLLLLVLPATILLTNNGDVVVGAQGNQDKRDKIEDILEGEDEEDEEIEAKSKKPTNPSSSKTSKKKVEGEDELEEEEPAAEEPTDVKPTEEEGEQEEQLKASPDADTTLLFTKNNEQEIPVNTVVQMLIGFANNGKSEFQIENIQASLRYPQDFTYYIYNFTTQYYNTVVEPNKETTLEYVVNPSEVFAARPFGLVIELHYKNNNDEIFMDAVFNETVTLVELDEGLDTETFFLYVFLAAVIVLLLVGAQQLFASFGLQKKRKTTKPVVETGTSNHNDVDYDWIPKENIQQAKKTPSPRRSPRRRTKRATGSGDD